MADSITGLPHLLAAFESLPAQMRAAAVRGITRATLIIHRDAIRNAPRSPSQAQKNARRKTKRDTSRRKKPTATTRTKRQGLERSIAFDVHSSQPIASVYVAANSEAGKYARRIHDEKGVSWKKRGPGTVAKGARADDKFIERALKENETHIGAIIEGEMRKVKL